MKYANSTKIISSTRFKTNINSNMKYVKEGNMQLCVGYKNVRKLLSTELLKSSQCSGDSSAISSKIMELEKIS